MIPQFDLFSFVFWRKLKTPKRHFEINWPLARAESGKGSCLFFCFWDFLTFTSHLVVSNIKSTFSILIFWNHFWSNLKSRVNLIYKGCKKNCGFLGGLRHWCKSAKWRQVSLKAWLIDIFVQPFRPRFFLKAQIIRSWKICRLSLLKVKKSQKNFLLSTIPPKKPQFYPSL